MNILVLGASGYLGGFLYHALSANHQVVGTYLSYARPELEHLDVANAKEVARLLQRPWDLILHAAGLVDVRDCAQNIQLTHAVNVAGTQQLAERAPCPIIYFSTDNVFDGHRAFYDEDAEPSPTSEYGRTKLEAERIILSANPANLVVRIPFLYGWSPYQDKFSRRFIQPITRVAHPISFNPLYLPDIVTHLNDLRRYQGLVHLGGETETTRYEFYQLVQVVLQLPTQIVPITPEEAFGVHQRPHKSILRSKRLPFRGRAAFEALQDLKRYYRDGLH